MLHKINIVDLNQIISSWLLIIYPIVSIPRVFFFIWRRPTIVHFHETGLHFAYCMRCQLTGPKCRLWYYTYPKRKDIHAIREIMKICARVYNVNMMCQHEKKINSTSCILYLKKHLLVSHITGFPLQTKTIRKEHRFRICTIIIIIAITTRKLVLSRMIHFILAIITIILSPIHNQ